MDLHFNEFNTTAEYNAFIEDGYLKPNVSYIEGVGMKYEKDAPLFYKNIYLTFVPLVDSSFSFQKKGNGNDIEYSTDNGATWTALQSNDSTPAIAAGSKIIWRGELIPVDGGSDESKGGIGTFSSTDQFNVEGNPMSLLFGDDFPFHKDLTGKDYSFKSLFLNCTHLINADNLALPATTLGGYNYTYMFKGCSSLESAVIKLPALTLPIDAYSYMFEGCSNLTAAPTILPATTLARGCYYCMFTHCTSLTTAPELVNAEGIKEYTYGLMFSICSSLNYVKYMGMQEPGDKYWLTGAALTGTFVKNSAATWDNTNVVPSGWEVVLADE